MLTVFAFPVSQRARVGAPASAATLGERARGATQGPTELSGFVAAAVFSLEVDLNSLKRTGRPIALLESSAVSRRGEMGGVTEKWAVYSHVQLPIF